MYGSPIELPKAAETSTKSGLAVNKGSGPGPAAGTTKEGTPGHPQSHTSSPGFVLRHRLGGGLVVARNTVARAARAVTRPVVRAASGAVGFAKRVPFLQRQRAGNGATVAARTAAGGRVQLAGSKRAMVLKAAVPVATALLLVPGKFLACAAFMAFFPRLGKLVVSLQRGACHGLS